jgi:hypothetical protein
MLRSRLHSWLLSLEGLKSRVLAALRPLNVDFLGRSHTDIPLSASLRSACYNAAKVLIVQCNRKRRSLLQPVCEARYAQITLGLRLP